MQTVYSKEQSVGVLNHASSERWMPLLDVLTHPRVEEWIQLLYGELLPERRRDLAVHLAQCDACAGKVKILKNVNEGELCKHMTPRTRILAF